MNIFRSMSSVTSGLGQPRFSSDANNWRKKMDSFLRLDFAAYQQGKQDQAVSLFIRFKNPLTESQQQKLAMLGGPSFSPHYTGKKIVTASVLLSKLENLARMEEVASITKSQTLRPL